MHQVPNNNTQAKCKILCSLNAPAYDGGIFKQ